jgi:hypothetical protein
MRKNRLFAKALLLSLSMMWVGLAFSQTTDALNTFTPYSIFGVGNISKQGTALNKAMGGIGIGFRDNRSINYLNPASISFRDTLAFMLDFGMEQNNNYYSSATSSSAYNTFNMHDFVMTFPIYKKSALIVGVAPYSSVGYKFEKKETDPEILNALGDVTYQKYGTGGINKLFLGGSAKIFKNLSFGAELLYYFGTIDRYSNINFSNSGSLRNIKTGEDFVINTISGKLGLQYSYNFDKERSLTLGATYLLNSKLKGERTKYAFSNTTSEAVDTVSYVVNTDTNLEIPGELGIGASYRLQDKWMIGADYVRQNWKNASVPLTPGVNFLPSVSSSIRLGGEYTPNRYDIRYYLKRVTYRAGVYYDKSYVSLNGQQINSFGITLGASLPIYRWYNAFGFSIDMGQRGVMRDGLVRERYIMLNLNISLHDIWFQKYRYD